MSLSETYLSRKELMASNLNDMGVTDASSTDGLTTLINSILDIPNKQSTSLTIELPLILEYTDEFNITGVLTGCNGGLTGKAVKLLVDGNVADTQNTTTGGAVSFTHSPVSVGNHTFQLVFDGDINYEASGSSIVEKEVNKETSVVNITSPTATNYYKNQTINVTGTLKDNDNTEIKNKNVKFKIDDTLIETLTTDNNGAFSTSVSVNTTGTKVFSIVFEGDSDYTSSTDSVSIVVVNPYITVTSDKSILSYKDSDEAVFTSQLYDSSVDGKSVVFDVRKVSDDSLVESLTGVTNSSGVATVTYSSGGVGDVYVTASYGSLLSETYTVEDCLLYDTTTHNTSDEPINYSISSPNKCKIEMDITKGATGSGALARAGDDANNCIQFGLLGSGAYGFDVRHGGSNVTQQRASNLGNGTHHCELTYDNGSITCKMNNQTFTYTYTQPLTKLISLHPWSSGSFQNIKVKPL